MSERTAHRQDCCRLCTSYSLQPQWCDALPCRLLAELESRGIPCVSLHSSLGSADFAWGTDIFKERVQLGLNLTALNMLSKRKPVSLPAQHALACPSIHFSAYHTSALPTSFKESIVPQADMVPWIAQPGIWVL